MKINISYDINSVYDIITLYKENKITLNEDEFYKVVMNQYKINKKTVSIIYNFAWTEHHSSGIEEVYSYFENYLDIFSECLESEKEIKV